MRLILAATVALAVSLSAAPSGQPGAFDPGAPGPYPVGHTSFVLEDTSRDATIMTAGGPITAPRPIPVHVFYPADEGDVASAPEAVYPLDMIYKPTDPVYLTLSSEWEAEGLDGAYQDPLPSADGPFPVVMFSPGWGLGAWDNLYVGTRLASHGFVVVILYHYGDRVFSHEGARYHVNLSSLHRPLDVSFVLTALLARNATPGDPFWNLMAPDQVAASGHSLGGYTAMALAGGDDSVCDLGLPNPPPETCVPAWPDTRIAAIVTLDGSAQLLWFDELARIDVPTLAMSRDWFVSSSGVLRATHAARLHSASQGHPAYRVDISGVVHTTFASSSCQATPILFAHGLISETAYNNRLLSRCGTDLAPAEAHRIITQYMVAFLETALAGEPGYQRYLTPGYALNQEPWVGFFVTEKRSPQSIDDEPGLFSFFPYQSGSEQMRAEKDPATWQQIPYYGGLGPR